jgi:hypothetical protein
VGHVACIAEMKNPYKILVRQDYLGGLNSNISKILKLILKKWLRKGSSGNIL